MKPYIQKILLYTGLIPVVLLLGVHPDHVPEDAITVQHTEPRVYIYTLHVIPHLLDVDNWTETENKIVSDHFNRLKQFMDDGIVILAGRVPVMDPESFGIVIFKADTEEDAVSIMENDPAVKEGIMTAKLFPFNIALIQHPETTNEK